jgi:hypothetical protein
MRSLSALGPPLRPKGHKRWIVALTVMCVIALVVFAPMLASSFSFLSDASTGVVPSPSVDPALHVTVQRLELLVKELSVVVQSAASPKSTVSGNKVAALGVGSRLQALAGDLSVLSLDVMRKLVPKPCPTVPATTVAPTVAAPNAGLNAGPAGTPRLRPVTLRPLAQHAANVVDQIQVLLPDSGNWRLPARFPLPAIPFFPQLKSGACLIASYFCGHSVRPRWLVSCGRATLRFRVRIASCHVSLAMTSSC